MPRQPAPEEQKRLIWERIVESALQHHSRESDYGIQKVIAADAGVSQQTVSKWKQLKVRPESSTIRKLAALYGVSSVWLSGLEEDESLGDPPDPPRFAERTKEEAERMHLVATEIVERVVLSLKPDAGVKEIMSITTRALHLLNEGRDEDQVMGILFREVSSSRAEELSHDP